MNDIIMHVNDSHKELADYKDIQMQNITSLVRTILVLGSGGREHALAWKLSKSESNPRIFIAPGNAGTNNVGVNVSLNISDFEEIKQFVLANTVDMVVVGPEQPLVDGIVDYFRNDEQLRHVLTVGPDRRGAMLEGSKAYAKKFMEENDIPTARCFTVTSSNLEEGLSHLGNMKSPYVLKADGLAAGKGVLIIESLDEARRELCNMLSGKFGNASSTVVIEDFLKGIEVSVFVLTDGNDYVILPEAKDYKRIGEGDKGLNTGGMGAVSPVVFADADFMKKVETRIIKPTLVGLKKSGIDYRGFIFLGLINVGGDPYVIEYNVRMGDPETECVLTRIKSDFAELMVNCARGTLSDAHYEADSRTAVTVMMVSGGYPEGYQKGKVITGIGNVCGCCEVFHAGTKIVNQDTVTSGGRVIAITAHGNSIEDARTKVYQEIEKIRFEGAYFRKDIGVDLMNYK